MGANVGVADVHNLSWKLALVLAGRASTELLSTYDLERRPVGLHAAEESAGRAGRGGLVSVGGGAGPGPAKGPRAGPVGYGYTSPAVANEPDAPAGPGTRLTDGRPGTRVPHVWTVEDGRRTSTLDLLDGGFVVLSADPASWTDAAEQVAADAGVPVTVRLVSGADQPVEGAITWSDAAGVGPTGALLVRPDGFVAWRTVRSPVNPTAALRQALAGLLRPS